MHFQLNKSTDIQSIISQIEKFVLSKTKNKIIVSEVVIISSEIIYNIIKFAPLGEFSIASQNNMFIINANDTGKGFSLTLEDSLKEGFSTANSLGLGLPSLFRMCDDIKITTSNIGTKICCFKEF